MGNILKGLLSSDNRLQKLFFYYVIAGVIFFFVLTICIVIHEYSRSLDQTLLELQKFEMNFGKIKEATKDFNQSVHKIKTMVPPDYFLISSEKQLLTGFDVLKTNAGDSAVTISEILYADEEISLPVTIKGHLKNYSDFVNNTGRLQAYKFPFYSIETVSISKDSASPSAPQEAAGQASKNLFIYEVTGNLKLPRSSQEVLGRTATDGS